MARLAGKTALITGGSTGIGLASAKLFQQEGAKVAITGQDETRLTEAQSQLGEAIAIRSNAGQVGAAKSLAGDVKARLGELDILFLNAGIAKFAGLAEVDEALFDEIFAINVKGVLFTVQALAPMMRDGGSIVVNTSVNSVMGMAGTLVYAASKAAAASLVRVLAGELAGRRIRVNAVSPGPVETPIYGKLGIPQEQVQAIAGSLIGHIPLGRFGQADEIAQAALFLASDESSFFTGSTITADGGWTGVMA